MEAKGTLPNYFYEDSITRTSKPKTSQENYSLVSLMNIYVNIPTKISANSIKQCIKNCMLQPRRIYSKYTRLVLKINWCNLSQPQGRESYYTKIKKALDKNSIPMHTKKVLSKPATQLKNGLKIWIATQSEKIYGW